MQNKLVFDSNLENDSDYVHVSMGMDDKLYDKILSRLRLFEEDTFREMKSKLAEYANEHDLSEKEMAQLMNDASKGKGKQRDKVLEIIGTHSYSQFLEEFLQSGLFKSLDWQPTTPNDFFCLGLLFKAFLNKSQSPDLSELLKVVEHILES